MRWALLADVHANLEALQAVLRDLEDWPGHRLVCAGDLVGYGPDPLACIELLGERAAACVVGNHDAMVIGRLPFDRCVHAGIVAAVWTRRNLPRWALDHLAALPNVVEPAPELVACHAAPRDLERRVGRASEADAVLDEVGRDSALLVGGHTHFAAVHARGGRFRLAEPGSSFPVGASHFVNPGSVGQARDGKHAARYARYDSERGTISFHALGYDAAPTLRKMRRHGLVPRVCYSLPLGRLDAIRSRLARLYYRDLPPL